MEGTYDVFMGQERIGRVNVTRQGLYLHISCRCNLSGEVMQQLVVSWSDGSYDLGLLTPKQETFGLETNVIAKQIGQENLKFSLRPRRSNRPSDFCPVRPEEPFRYLHRLEQAFLRIHNGQQGIGFREEK